MHSNTIKNWQEIFCYRLNCISQKRYVEALTQGTCDYKLIWKQGLWKYNTVKMRSFGLALIQYGLYPHKKRKIPCEDRHTGSTPCRDKGRNWSEATTSHQPLKVYFKYIWYQCCRNIKLLVYRVLFQLGVLLKRPISYITFFK